MNTLKLLVLTISTCILVSGVINQDDGRDIYLENANNMENALNAIITGKCWHTNQIPYSNPVSNGTRRAQATNTTNSSIINSDDSSSDDSQPDDYSNRSFAITDETDDEACIEKWGKLTDQYDTYKNTINDANDNQYTQNNSVIMCLAANVEDKICEKAIKDFESYTKSLKYTLIDEKLFDKYIDAANHIDYHWYEYLIDEYLAKDLIREWTDINTHCKQVVFSTPGIQQVKQIPRTPLQESCDKSLENINFFNNLIVKDNKKIFKYLKKAKCNLQTRRLERVMMDKRIFEESEDCKEAEKATKQYAASLSISKASRIMRLVALGLAAAAMFL